MQAGRVKHGYEEKLIVMKERRAIEDGGRLGGDAAAPRSFAPRIWLAQSLGSSVIAVRD